MIEQTRRGLITGLVSLVAAPAIVRATSIMPIKPLVPTGTLVLSEYMQLTSKIYQVVVHENGSYVLTKLDKKVIQNFEQLHHELITSA